MDEFSEQYRCIHPKFELNGTSYKRNSLRKQATWLIENGEPFEEVIGSFIMDWLNDKSYVNVQTSGSTGSPKLIKIKKSHMVNSAKATAKHFDIKEKTTALLCLPVQFIAGKMMLVRALVLGWKIDVVRPQSAPLDTVYRRYDFCAMTPFQVDNSLGRLHLISKLIVGGAPISPSLMSSLQNIETKVYETYGMTETVTHIAARRINPKVQKDNIPFKTLYKVTVETDERECLIVKAPLVSTDPVITNDIVSLLTYKKFIWLGRIDNVINSGGVKLHPEQIEQKLAPFITSPYFIAGIVDEKLGQRLTLFVEQEKDFAFAKAYSKEDLSEEYANFKPFEFPTEIITLPKFERTENGKLQRGLTVRKALL